MNARSRADSVRCLGCSQPGIVGLCAPGDTIRDLEAAVAHAPWETLPRLRAPYWRQRLDHETRSAEQIGVGHVTLSLDWARARAGVGRVLTAGARRCSSISRGRLDEVALAAGAPASAPAPRRDLLGRSPEVRAKPPAAFTDALGRVPLLERVDRDRRSLGVDLVRVAQFDPPPPWAGQA